MGVNGGSTFSQGDPSTPAAHPVPKSSDCQTVSTVGNGVQVTVTSASAANSSSVSRYGGRVFD